MRSAPLGMLIAIGSALTLATPAGAAEIVGSNLAADPGTGPAPNIGFVQTVQPTGVTMPLTATASGVIVSISVRHGTSGANPGVYGFRVLSGTSPNFTATGAPAALPDFTWPANETPGTRVFIPTSGGAPVGIPIAAGQRVGMSRFTGTAGQGAQIWTSLGGAMAGATLRTASPGHDTGPVNYAFSNANTEALLQYVIEPDADGDGFGDDTQDLCKGTAGTKSGCAPIVVPSTPSKTKKCKKKKKKRAALAKKCKKRAKKK